MSYHEFIIQLESYSIFYKEVTNNKTILEHNSIYLVVYFGFFRPNFQLFAHMFILDFETLNMFIFINFSTKLLVT